MAKYKGKDINTTPTDGMVREARRGLEWRKEHGRGGTAVGVARARDISNRTELSIDTVRRMHSFFARHAVDAKAKGFRPGEKGYPSAGRIAHALWGGTPGRSFAARVVKQADAADERAMTGSVKKALAKKATDHNEKVGDSASKRTNARTLGAVFNRGVGAYKTNPGSVRPSVTSPEQWAYARVNSFLYALRNGKFRGGKHDTDLLPSGHPMSSKGRDESLYEERVMDEVDVSEFLEDELLEDETTEVEEIAEEERSELVEEQVTEERHVKNVVETDDELIVTFGKDMTADQEDERADGDEVKHRSMALERGYIDEDSRRVKMAISSEEPVQRSFGMEVLEHSERAIDLSFLRSGRAPLLLDHDPEKQIGVIESVDLDGSARRLRATVRFGRSGLAKEAFDDVTDGIRANISVGYAINKMERDKEKDDRYIARSWRPVEASLVSIPADVTVGVGRSNEPSPQPSIKTNFKETNMSEVDHTAVEAEAKKTAQREAAQIMALTSKHNLSELGHQALTEGRSFAEVQGLVLDKIGTKPLDTGEIGLSKQEKRNFSLIKVAEALANPTSKRAREAAAFEFEVSEAACKQYGREAEGMLVPFEVLAKRDLNSADEDELFSDDYRGGEFIDVLRNSSSVMQAGARILTGLSGDVVIPKKATAASAGWISTEGGNVSESEMTTSSVTMVPRHLGAHTDITRQLRQQSSLSVEALVRDDLTSAIALQMDLGALQGSGSSGQPTGIKNVSGINTVDFGTSPVLVPSFAKVVDMETAVAEDNALLGNLAYILPAAMYGGLKTTEKASNTAQFIVEPGGTINGYRAIVSNQCTAGDMFFGNFDDLLIGMWSGVDLTVDQSALALSGGIRLIAIQTMDVAVRHAVSFCLGNDDQ
jgi:HK97 family phage major capsid protein